MCDVHGCPRTDFFVEYINTKLCDEHAYLASSGVTELAAATPRPSPPVPDALRCDHGYCRSPAVITHPAGFKFCSQHQHCVYLTADLLAPEMNGRVSVQEIKDRWGTPAALDDVRHIWTQRGATFTKHVLRAPPPFRPGPTCSQQERMTATLVLDGMKRHWDATNFRSAYPHTCPRCGAAAYVGLNKVDCKASCNA